jgi:hypothetical protein
LHRRVPHFLATLTLWICVTTTFLEQRLYACAGAQVTWAIAGIFVMA